MNERSVMIDEPVSPMAEMLGDMLRRIKDLEARVQRLEDEPKRTDLYARGGC